MTPELEAFNDIDKQITEKISAMDPQERLVKFNEFREIAEQRNLDAEESRFALALIRANRSRVAAPSKARTKATPVNLADL